MLATLALCGYGNVKASGNGNGQNPSYDNGWNQVPIGGCGYITGIVAHPLGQDVVYARVDVGGALRWDEAGQQWLPITDMFNSTVAGSYNCVESINVDPRDINVVYFACGRGGQQAIFRSTDRGNSWTDTGWKGGIITGNGQYRWCGERLAVDPANSNVVYFGSRKSGLWVNNNPTVFGKWVQIPKAQIPFGGGLSPAAKPENNVGVTFVTFDPSGGTTADGKTKIIYAGVWGGGAGVGGVYKSTDAGATWARIPGGPTHPMRGAIAANGTLVVTEQGNEKNDFKSGAVWYCPGGGSFAKSTGPKVGGYSGLSVDPTNPNNVLVITQNSFNNNDLYKSTDGGKIFKAVTKTKGSVEAPWFLTTKDGGYFINRSSSVVYDQTNHGRVWVSGWYTTWRTEDINATTTIWNTAVRGHEGFAVRFLMSPPAGPSVLFTGIGDSSGFRTGDVNQYPDWLPGSGDVNLVDYCWSNPSVMYFVSMNRSELIGGLKKSTDYGVTWSSYVPVSLPAGVNLPDGCSSMVGGRIAVSATDPDRLVWLPYRMGQPYTSGDGGKSWAACKGVEPAKTTDLIENSYLPQRQPLAASKAASNYMYYATAGSQAVQFYSSNDGGVSFKKTGAGLPAAKSSDWMVKAVPNQDGGVWISLENDGFYVSKNFGKTFTKLPGVARVKAFGFGKSGSDAPACVYMIGLLTGDAPSDGNRIYRSDDMGVTWTRINDDDHQYGTAEYIEGDGQVYGRVFIGTSGRGVIRHG